MAGNDSLRLTEILNRLTRDWCSNYADRHQEMWARLEPYHEADTPPELIHERDELEATFESHPYRVILRQVCQKTRFPFRVLDGASRQQFEGYREIGSALDELDANGTTAKLTTELYDRWPEVAARLFGEAGSTTSHTVAEATQTEDTAAESTGSQQAARQLLNLYTNGLSDERFQRAAAVLRNEQMTAHEKLTKINSIVPFPPTASAEKLGKLLGCTAAAVKQTQWWLDHRKGKHEETIDRRHEVHKGRAKQMEPDISHDDED